MEGQVVTWELKNKYNNEIEWNSLDEDTVMIRSYRTKYSFINHSDNPNLHFKYFPLRLEAIEDIPQGVELTIDYNSIKIPEKYKKEIIVIDF